MQNVISCFCFLGEIWHILTVFDRIALLCCETLCACVTWALVFERLHYERVFTKSKMNFQSAVFQPPISVLSLVVFVSTNRQGSEWLRGDVWAHYKWQPSFLVAGLIHSWTSTACGKHGPWGTEQLRACVSGRLCSTPSAHIFYGGLSYISTSWEFCCDGEWLHRSR